MELKLFETQHNPYTVSNFSLENQDLSRKIIWMLLYKAMDDRWMDGWMDG